MRRRLTRTLGYTAALLAIMAVATASVYLVLLTGAERARETSRRAVSCLRELESLETTQGVGDIGRMVTIREPVTPECKRLLSHDPSSSVVEAQIEPSLLFGGALVKDLAENRLNELVSAGTSQVEPGQSPVMQLVRGGMLVISPLAVGFAIWFLRRQARDEAEEFELESARILHGQAESPHYDKLVAINVKHLDAYYLLVKGQTSNSFFVTLAVSIAGFAFITAGLVVAFGSATSETTVLAESRFVWIATGSGVIVEFVAAIFFFLYNRTVRQLRQYHESLIGVQNTLLAFRMVEQVSPETDQNKVAIIQQVVNYLLREGQKLPTRPDHAHEGGRPSPEA